MTLVKDSAKQIKVHDGNKPDGRTAAHKIAERVGTPSLLWLLVKRHKVGLLTIGNIVLVLNWVFPPWTDFVKSFLTGLF